MCRRFFTNSRFMSSNFITFINLTLLKSLAYIFKKGDSGGPFFVKSNGAYYVAGIVSASFDDCEGR